MYHPLEELDLLHPPLLPPLYHPPEPHLFPPLYHPHPHPQNLLHPPLSLALASTITGFLGFNSLNCLSTLSASSSFKLIKENSLNISIFHTSQSLDHVSFSIN